MENFWDKLKSKMSEESKILDLGDNANLFKNYKFYTPFKDYTGKTSYDCVILTNYLEYTPFYEVELLWWLYKLPSKGILVLTISFNPIDDDIFYYKHLTEKDLRSFLNMSLFHEYCLEFNTDNDLLFYGIKK